MVERIKTLFKSYGLGGIRKSLHLAISQSFIALLFILTDFIFSKQLTVAEFGVWKEIFFFFNLGIPLLAFGLPEGYKYFIAKEKNISFYFNNLLFALIAIALLLLLVLGILNILHLLNFINLGNYYGYSLLFPLPLLAFLLNKSLRYSYINFNEAEKLTKLSLYGAIGSLILIVSGIFLLNEHNDILILIAILIYFGIFFFPTLMYFKNFPSPSIRLTFNKEALKKMMVYGLPLYLATFAGLLSNYLDKLIVNVSSDETTFAIFAVGAFEIPIFAMLSAAFSQQIFPKMVRHIDEGQENRAKNLWIETTKKVSLITYPIILIIMFFSEEIIFLVYNENYEASVILFKTYLLVALFRNNSYGILLTAKGETKVVTKIAIVVLLLNLVISICLFYFYGLRGVVFGTLISAFIFISLVLYKENMVLGYINQVLLSKKIAPLVFLILIVYFLF